MGISTFVHLITDKEASVIKAAPDSIINKLIWALCDRPSVSLPGDPAPADGEEEKTVSVLATLYELLAPPAGSEEHDGKEGGEQEGEESEVYLEQGTKFWSASISGMFVSVSFGKKGTDGQSNSHSGPDARQYFEDKVHEKLRKGYKRKDPEGGAKGMAISALKKLALVSDGAAGAADDEAAAPEPAEEAGPARRSKRKAAGGAADGGGAPAPKKGGGAQKKGGGGPKDGPLRFPTETEVKKRCDLDKCGALCAYILSKLTHVRVGDEDETFASTMVRTKVGKDVCYGPAYVVSAKETAVFAGLVEDKATAERIEKVFDEAVFPGALGGVCNVTKEKDLEYATGHTLRMAALLKHAKELKCGLLIHFW